MSQSLVRLSWRIATSLHDVTAPVGDHHQALRAGAASFGLGKSYAALWEVVWPQLRDMRNRSEALVGLHGTAVKSGRLIIGPPFSEDRKIEVRIERIGGEAR